MIPLSARRSQLARRVVPSRCHIRAPIALRRNFSASITHRNNETNGKDETGKSPGSSTERSSGGERLINAGRQIRKEMSVMQGLGGKKKSRLAALKSKPSKTRVDDGHNPEKGSEAAEYIFGKSRDKPIRTRFAPSPTGYLHLGSLRTALFNNLLAKATKGGEFILRLEDTDQKRLVADAETRLVRDLRWAGLEWTEGPDKGGPYGPYRQSERLDIYREHTKTLLENGSAYRCFCSHETLEAHSRAQHQADKPTVYPGTCRSIPAADSDKRAAAGEPYIVRLNSEKFGRPSFKDAIYGPFQKNQDEEDFVLMKRDGYPTYHLANVVDDHLMKITHVVRGEEWLISTPKHIALYKAFGWEPPTFAHLALLVNNDGSKLSKRNASVDLSTYRLGNILPPALQAWLANLGSSFRAGVATPRTLEDIANALTFKFTRGGIKLNPEKLAHYQSQYRKELFHVNRTPREAFLLRSCLLDPLARAILARTKDPRSSPPIRPSNAKLPWDGPLTLVPELQISEDTRRRYLFLALRLDRSNYTDVTELMSDMPYMFWRPPLDVYRAGIANYDINRPLFDTVAKIMSCTPENWHEALATMLRSIKKENSAASHALVRLILAGDAGASTRSTGIMFRVLGQAECLHRLSVAQGLLEELEQGGPELKKQWQAITAVEAREMSSEMSSETSLEAELAKEAEEAELAKKQEEAETQDLLKAAFFGEQGEKAAKKDLS